MNTFFIVVTFVMASATQLDRPLFVFAKPNFDEYMKCWNYVQVNNMNIYRTAANEYNFKHKPEAIFVPAPIGGVGVHVKEYGATPPTGLTVAEPSQLPPHDSLVNTSFGTMLFCVPIIVFAVVVQPFASVIVTL